MLVAAPPSGSTVPRTAPAPGPKPTPTSRRVKLPSLYPYLARVPDPRDARGRRHPLPAILALVCLAMLSGIHGYLPAAQWARKLSRRQRRKLGFRRGRTPAASTLFEVLQALSWEALEAELRAWMAAAELGESPVPGAAAAFTPDPDGRALDGKTARGSWKRGAEIAHMLAVVTHQLGLTVAQAPVARKRGELTAARPLLQQLVLTGLVVTVDAQFTQRDLARSIGAQGGDYVMRVKENQPTLRAEIEALLSPAAWEPGRRHSATASERGHGRQETRQLIVQPLRDGELDWPGAKQVFVVVSRRRAQPGKPTPTTRIYGVTSLDPDQADATRLLRLFRGHWSVENKAFWVRDKVLGEDASPVATGNIVAVLASLRGAVLNLCRSYRHGGVARTLRELNADRAAAFRLLGCP
jgi:predicted transposase YbfD/YdcC